MKAYYRPNGTIIITPAEGPIQVPQGYGIVVDLSGLEEGGRKLRLRKPSYTHEVPAKPVLLIHAAGPTGTATPMTDGLGDLPEATDCCNNHSCPHHDGWVRDVVGGEWYDPLAPRPDR